MRLFKTEFFGKNEHTKTIISLSCRVVSSKRFEAMDEEDKVNAVNAIERWEKSLQAFKNDILSKGK